MNKFIKFFYLLLLVCAQAQGMDHQDQLNRQLRDAAIASNLELVKQLIEAKADVNYQDRAFLRSALIIAAQNDDLPCVQALIQAKADANLIPLDDDTALKHAAANGFVPCLNALLEAKADVNITGERGSSALINAVRYDHLPCITILIAAGAKLNFRANQYTDTALEEATYRNRNDICEALIEAMLHLPNQTQEKSIIALLGLNKFQQALGFLGFGTGKKFADFFKPYLRAALYNQNNQDFQNSIACQKINELPDCQYKKDVLEKYSNKPK